MTELSHLYTTKAGMPPGSLIHVGEKKKDVVRICVLDYDTEKVWEGDLDHVDDTTRFRDSATVSWINVTGIHDHKVISRLGELYSIDPLILEDVMNTGHRPKVEDMGQNLFFTLKMLYTDDAGHICSEQVSLILGQSYVISFQEDEDDIFDSIRDRIRNATGLVRKRGADFLVYRLVDTVVDHYFVVLDTVEASIDVLEDDLMRHPGQDHMRRIQAMKHDLIFLRRSIMPLRDAVSSLEKGLSKLVDKHTARYFRDVYDHIIHISDTLDSHREVLKGLTDIQLANQNNRMNEVMKVLTVISTIFIPLTFIVGVYGMNFQFMPELGWRWGYPAVWVLMSGILFGLVYYFKRKKWF